PPPNRFWRSLPPVPRRSGSARRFVAKTEIRPGTIRIRGCGGRWLPSPDRRRPDPGIPPSFLKRPGSSFSLHPFILVENRFGYIGRKLHLHAAPGPEQKRFHRTDGLSEDARDFLVIQLVVLPQDERRPLLLRQVVDRFPDHGHFLLPEHRFFRQGVPRLDAGDVAA